MHSIFVFLDLAKFADFRWKNGDVSRTQGVCHVIHIHFGPSVDKVYFVPSFIIVGYVWQILRREAFLPAIREQPQKSPSWIGLSLVSSSLLIRIPVRNTFLVMKTFDWSKNHIKNEEKSVSSNIWVQEFKNGANKICGRQPLKNLKGYGLLSLQIF